MNFLFFLFTIWNHQRRTFCIFPPPSVSAFLLLYLYTLPAHLPKQETRPWSYLKPTCLLRHYVPSLWPNQRFFYSNVLHSSHTFIFPPPLSARSFSLTHRHDIIFSALKYKGNFSCSCLSCPQLSALLYSELRKSYLKLIITTFSSYLFWPTQWNHNCQATDNLCVTKSNGLLSVLIKLPATTESAVSMLAEAGAQLLIQV